MSETEGLGKIDIGLSPDFRMSRAENEAGEVFFNFNNSLERGFDRQIRVSSKVLPSGNMELDMNPLPLDAAELPALAEDYIKDQGSKPVRKFKNGQHNIKSSDGQIEFEVDHSRIEQSAYVKIRLGTNVPDIKGSTLRLAPIISKLEWIPEAEIVKMLTQVAEARAEKVSPKG